MERPVLTTDLVEISTKRGWYASPTSSTEMALAEVLSGVVQVKDIPVGSHFFDDLGADSMVMAQFCARVRKRSDLPSVSMKDIYQHPTIKDLAATFAEPADHPHRLPPPVRTKAPWPRCWPGSCRSTTYPSAATSSTTSVRTRW